MKKTMTAKQAAPKATPTSDSKRDAAPKKGNQEMEKIHDGLRQLIEQGKEKGYLTYGQINEVLPEEDASPDKLDKLLINLEEQGRGARRPPIRRSRHLRLRSHLFRRR